MILSSIRGKQQFQWSDRKVSTISPFHPKIVYYTYMNKTNTKTEYQVVRNFFNDAQWDLIDAALNEYQDHFDTDEDSSVLDSVGEKLQNVFDNSVDQSDLMSEGA